MTVTREDIAREARKLKGTPWHHQGRVPGVGIDCVGTILLPPRALGLTDFEFVDYKRQPDPSSLWAALRELENINLIRKIPVFEAVPWDFVVMRADDDPTHFAWLTETGILHTRLRRTGKESKCVEHRMNQAMRDKIIAAYRIVGVSDE